MKNLLRISFLLLLVFALFVSCGERAGSGNTPGANTDPLFDESEANTPVSVITMNDLADGQWEFKYVYWYNPANYSSQTLYAYYPYSGSVTFTCTEKKRQISQIYNISNGSKTCVSGTEVEEYTMDAENKSTVNTFAINHGITIRWNGTTGIITEDNNYDWYFDYFLDYSNDTGYTAKKNEAGTKFFVKSNSTGASYGYIYYLQKK